MFIHTNLKISNFTYLLMCTKTQRAKLLKKLVNSTVDEAVNAKTVVLFLFSCFF